MLVLRNHQVRLQVSLILQVLPVRRLTTLQIQKVAAQQEYRYPLKYQVQIQQEYLGYFQVRLHRLVLQRSPLLGLQQFQRESRQEIQVSLQLST
jgi:hypothetical protein